MTGMTPLDLLMVVRGEKIGFKAWAKDSYRKTLLRLKNESLNEIQIDVSRSGLTAKTGETQTIGLSYPVESSPGDHILLLKSGQEKEMVFNSRCLDRGGKPPENETEFVLIPNLLADYVADLLQQGADQGEVWDAIESRKGEITRKSPIPAIVDKFQ